MELKRFALFIRIIFLGAISLFMVRALLGARQAKESFISSTPIQSSKISRIDTAPTIPTGASIIVLNGQKYIITKTGDMVGFLKVSRYDHSKEEMYSIVFKGEIKVTAKYVVHDNTGEGMDSLFNNLICLSDLNQESLAQIPMLEIDERDVWFCFSNIEAARNLFKGYPKNGTATVTIDNYTISYAPMETFNSAVLKKMVSVK